MFRPGMSNRPDPSQRPTYQARLVVKLRDQEDTRARVASLAVAARPGGEGPIGPSQLDPLVRQFPGASVVPLSSVSTARLQSLTRDAQRAAGDQRVPNLASFFAVTVPRGTEPQAMVRFAQSVSGVESAELEGAPTPPPVSPANDPRSTNQGYLLATATGIDARYAWTIPGGDGRGITFFDIEQGWTLNHEDLSGAGITLVSGRNQAYPGHGTAVLGEVMAQDNTRGCIGITPLVTGRVVSQWRTNTVFSTFDAIISALFASRPGDVILLEAQTTVGGSTYLPVEVEFNVFAAIWVSTLLGRVVVEAGGNGSNDLDTYRDASRGFILKRGHADFRDSGAIMVGAASSTVPHSRLSFSNYGSRIDCYGWGERIDTTGDGWQGTGTTLYTTTFGGTSGASPIVTGAAIALQGMNKARHGRVLSPRRVREVLSDPRNGTRTNVPAADRIGSMPDLRKIVKNLNLAPAPVTTTTPARTKSYQPELALASTALIDPGHGGAVDEADSSAYGSPNGRGIHSAAHEKEINLEVARRVCDRLGQAGVLTRSGDYNLSLRERIERARAANAAAFVSIHSNTGRTDHGGPEVWVFGDPHQAAGPSSLQLAQRIQHELSTAESGPVAVRTGRLGVLQPELHGPGVAACLVETGSLEHPGGAARLSQPESLERISDAVARGVSSYLAHDFRRPVSYGGSAVMTERDTAEDRLTPAQVRRKRVVPQVCFHRTAEAAQANWWDLDLPAGALVDTAPAQLRELLAFLGVSYATYAPREGAYFGVLTEHLQRHQIVPSGTRLDRSSYADAVRTFQSRKSIPVDGIPSERTLWELQKDWALTRRIGTDDVAADKVPGSGGFNRFRLRKDIVDRYNSLRRAVQATGGVITSAGSFRELGATVTPGRSATSMHYSGLALDLATDTGMRNTRQTYLITREGARRWRVWCRSDSAPERTLDAVLWSNGQVRTESVTTRCFDFTALAEANGFSGIGPRSTFPANYMSAEWWHFQCELPLQPYFSQFGIELLSLGLYTEAQLARHTGLWANRTRIFKRGHGGWY